MTKQMTTLTALERANMSLTFGDMKLIGAEGVTDLDPANATPSIRYSGTVQIPTYFTTHASAHRMGSVEISGRVFYCPDMDEIIVTTEVIPYYPTHTTENKRLVDVRGSGFRHRLTCLKLDSTKQLVALHRDGSSSLLTYTMDLALRRALDAHAADFFPYGKYTVYVRTGGSDTHPLVTPTPIDLAPIHPDFLQENGQPKDVTPPTLP